MQQRKTIRLLAIGVMALSVIAAAAVIVMLSNGAFDSNRSSTNANVDQPADSTHQSSAANAPLQDTALPSVDAANETSDAAATEKLEAASSAPANAPANAIDVNVMLAQAQEHLGLAEQEEGDIAGRIAAYEAALTILKEIDAKASADQKPADLADRITTVDRALNDLKLKMYFP